MPVSEPSDSYLIWGEEDLDVDDAKFAGKSAIGRVDWTESLDSYLCKEYAREASIPWLRMKAADAALRLEQRYTSGLVNRLRLRRERQVAAAYSVANGFASTVLGGGGGTSNVAFKALFGQ